MLLLASDPRAQQANKSSRRLTAGSYAAYFAGFGILAAGIPLLATTSGATQQGLASLVATATLGWALASRRHRVAQRRRARRRSLPTVTHRLR